MGARLAHSPLAASALDFSRLAARLSASASAGAAVASRAHGSRAGGGGGGGGGMMAAAGAASSSASASSSSGLAGGRAPRRTAGNRLSGLLNAEEEDEFYQTTYGGFTEESGDDEYKGDQSDSEDEVDSDFDIDEGDEPSSDQDDSVPKRKRRVVTKAYKEPIKSLRLKKPDVPASSSQKTREDRSAPAELEDTVDSRKYMRQSTTEHTRQTFLRLQERQVQSRRKKGGGPSYDRPLTQEELLREAKITEELNLRSLETYERLEADKKRQVQKKRKCTGPTIRYYSGTMPLISDLGYKEENVDVEGLEQEGLLETPSAAAPAAKCSRTFITFSDDETFRRVFPRAPPPKLPVKEICPVSHKTAVYRDPVTDIPYSNIRSFKIIREAYKKYITAHGLPSAGASAALAAGSPMPDPGIRPTRQKIIIKQSVPAP
ncbi:vacuolar protein sorting-associated protein 72 homolog [Notechis scutatus]|uniref:Vacuolar protein sorting-associated protein 72 homolog n=1 Tax=Notechis scutatus TaxID=8663 RepID=A0A6J1VEL6_9SAUR|nr:vacuolar protein sorting-associated protein 72 homolog [Notechis scutatus]